MARDVRSDLLRLEHEEKRRPETPAGGGRVSMAHVAARAGVSGQTVSRVVNGSPHVEEKTRVRVERAMVELGYRPHRAARALRTGRTRTIGVVVATLETVGNSRMLEALAEAASDRGYALVVVLARGADAVADAFDRLRDQGVDGAIVLNEATTLARAVSLPADLRLVVVDSPPDARFSIVQTDHAGGARAATAHLIALGRRSVHHLAGPVGSFAAAERERGWREALAEAAFDAPSPTHGDWYAASGYDRAGALVAAGADAIFAANDQLALGALRALAEAGRRVPDDVAVVGFDGIADGADYQPPLTTVRQDFAQLAARAVARLVAAIEQDAPPATDTVAAALVVRASA